MGHVASHRLVGVGLLWALGAGLAGIPQPGAAEVRATRAVQFAVIPAGAELMLDGARVRWFGVVLALAPGWHDVAVDVPGSSCCVPLRTRIHVSPAATGRPAGAERFVLRLELRPARVVLVGGPCHAVYSCPELGLVGATGRIDQVTLPAVQWSGRCWFTAAGSTVVSVATVTLAAGELNAVPWPR